MSYSLRLATHADIPALEALIIRSVMELQVDYSHDQRRGALGTVFGVDTQLLKDGSYFVVELGGHVVACGGWSRRKTLFGGDAIAGKDDNALDPRVDAARIRAFFVHPDHTRRGLGTLILRACEEAAKVAGFSRFELVATLSGVVLYAAHGFQATDYFETPLPDGLMLPVVAMSKTA